jgi:hypothetical protein
LITIDVLTSLPHGRHMLPALAPETLGLCSAGDADALVNRSLTISPLHLCKQDVPAVAVVPRALQGMGPVRDGLMSTSSVGRATLGALLALMLTPAAVAAADWPEVKTSAKSAAPQCATPGRMMALVKARNGNLDARFETIAVDYMRQGEAMGLRWDYAFYQMLVETHDLTFKKGVRGGAVKPDQNNFGGIGTMGGNEAGESFKTVADGVRAHLEHLTVYAGLNVENALSERTKKFQSWDKFKEIQASLKGRPASFSDVIGHWAPKSRAYLDGVEKLAETFNSDLCKKADPKPDLMAGVRAVKTEKPLQVAEAKTDLVVEKPSGADLAKKAVDNGKAESNNVRTNLGAGLAKAKAQPPEVKIINEPPAAKEPEKAPPVQQASVAAGAAKALPKTEPPKMAQGPKCRVWTASYGQDKALIIKSVVDGITNFTVLDVNAGQEKVEADAYIARYAVGGKIEAQFASQAEALDKAFDLCPEG